MFNVCIKHFFFPSVEVSSKPAFSSLFSSYPYRIGGFPKFGFQTSQVTFRLTVQEEFEQEFDAGFRCI